MKKTPKDFNFIMISAMYENGGNTTQRFLDGHPNIYTYPYESQVGTKYVQDFLTTVYPLKYRWPVFPVDINPEDAYELIIDEEAKVRAKTPHVSKFRDTAFDSNDKERKQAFVNHMKGKVPSKAAYMEAFFKATFETWNSYQATGKETHYLGYSPIIGVDGDKIIKDLNGKGYVIHVMRNPFSAYADTKKRAVPQGIAQYMFGWVTCQYYASIFAQKYPNNFFILRYEDLIADSQKALGSILKKISLPTAQSLKYPSWNGEELKQVYPWGTIKIPTPEINIKTAKELSKEEIQEIYVRTKDYIEKYDYSDIYKKISS